MNVDRFRYELKLMGKRVILTPILVMLGFALLALLVHYLKVNPGRIMSAALEMILPLMTGIVVAVITTQDPTLELHLTMPKKYHLTAIRRLALILLWTALVALVSSLVLLALHLAYIPQDTPTLSQPLQFLAGQLTWVATLIWYAAAGLCLALLTCSRTASAAILSSIWIVEIIFKDFFAATAWLKPVFLFPTTLLSLNGTIPQTLYVYWLDNRLEVLATALVLLPIGWLLLRNPEALLKGVHEE
jgi:hypothetical protein